MGWETNDNKNSNNNKIGTYAGFVCSIKRDFLELQNVIPQRNSSVDELKERMITAETQKRKETEERQYFFLKILKKSFSEHNSYKV